MTCGLDQQLEYYLWQRPARGFYIARISDVKWDAQGGVLFKVTPLDAKGLMAEPEIISVSPPRSNELLAAVNGITLNGKLCWIHSNGSEAPVRTFVKLVEESPVKNH